MIASGSQTITAPPLLETVSLSKSFKRLKALSEHRLQVWPREILGVIGPNGSGKSTLFNLISGFLTPSSGEVFFEGRTLAGFPPAEVVRLGIARTFQGTRLFKDLSVLENVRAAAQLRQPTHLLEGVFGTPGFNRQRGIIETQARDLLERVGLGMRAKLRAGSLPYGEQRRLEIARALATDPKLLMLDEPAAGLDSSETAELLELLLSLRNTFGVTILVIEHDMDLIMNLCERIQVLAQGETIALGSPLEVQKNPRVRAAYLGDDLGDDVPGQSNP